MTLGNSCEHATTNTCDCDQENKIQDGHFSIIKKNGIRHSGMSRSRKELDSAEQKLVCSTKCLPKIHLYKGTL